MNKGEDEIMKAVLWGSRGSLPASLNAETIRTKIFKAIEAANGIKFAKKAEIDEFIENVLPFNIKGCYGSNTSCVEIKGGEDYVLCDAGSGIRDFGNWFVRSPAIKKPAHFHIFLSHLHWDHIHGFPFFTPIYIPGNVIDIYGCHEDIKSSLVNQNASPNFPISFDSLNADIRFNVLEPEKEYDISGIHVKGKGQDHPGKSYGYSFEINGKKIVYSTDSEHRIDADSKEYPFLDFFRNADLLIFDAQYSFVDAVYSKLDWGHSSNMIGIEISMRSKVKHLCMFHSEPTCEDEKLDKIVEDSKKYAKIYDDSYNLKVSMAYDGMEIDV